jgi:hypothetical protein
MDSLNLTRRSVLLGLATLALAPAVTWAKPLPQVVDGNELRLLHRLGGTPSGFRFACSIAVTKPLAAVSACRRNLAHTTRRWWPAMCLKDTCRPVKSVAC